MGWPAIIEFLKAILPTKKIGAWIVGILAAIVALVMGISNTDLKTQFCASEPVNLPAIKIAPAVPAVVAPAPDVKK
jgi:uncharacterized integral membrane protein